MDTVLIAEDNPVLLKILQTGLRQYQDRFVIVTAKDGQEAIDLLKETPASLLVTDLQMPKVDGLTLLTYMNEHHPQVPCIVMTAHGTPQLKERVSKEVLRFIEKPFEVDELAKTILSALDQDRLTGQILGISIPTFLQMVQMEQKTCLLEIDTAEGQQGYFYFEEGILFDAISGDLRGEAAALSLIPQDRVKIRFKNFARGQKKINRRIHKELMAVILEGIRLKDEAAADAVPGTDLPPEADMDGDFDMLAFDEAEDENAVPVPEAPGEALEEPPADMAPDIDEPPPPPDSPSTASDAAPRDADEELSLDDDEEPSLDIEEAPSEDASARTPDVPPAAPEDLSFEDDEELTLDFEEAVMADGTPAGTPDAPPEAPEELSLDDELSLDFEEVPADDVPVQTPDTASAAPEEVPFEADEELPLDADEDVLLDFDEGPSHAASAEAPGAAPAPPEGELPDGGEALPRPDPAPAEPGSGLPPLSALDRYLRELSTIGGYRASAILDRSGDILVGDAVGIEFELEYTAAMLRNLYRSAEKTCEDTGFDAIRELTMATPSGILMMAGTEPEAPVHLLVLLILESDGNRALGRLSIRRLIPRLVSELT